MHLDCHVAVLLAMTAIFGLPRRRAPDGTTGHLTKPASWQVIGHRNDSGFRFATSIRFAALATIDWQGDVSTKFGLG
jgi:hypothetical protein